MKRCARIYRLPSERDGVGAPSRLVGVVVGGGDTAVTVAADGDDHCVQGGWLDLAGDRSASAAERFRPGDATFGTGATMRLLWGPDMVSTHP